MPFLQNFETLEETCKALGIECPTDPDKRIEFRELWSNRKKMWAHKKLVNVWGLECLSKYDGCNNFSQAEITDEINNLRSWDK